MVTEKWIELESTYGDEFGRIAHDVYQAAGRIWPRAQVYAVRHLGEVDPSRAQTLMLKATAQVTRARDENHRQVTELDGYLFQTFKNIIHAEREKDDRRKSFEAGMCLNVELQGQAENVERRILLNELVKAMDDWTRRVFLWRTLDYSFDDIARHLGTDPQVVRNRFRRHVKQLMKKVNTRR